MSRTPILFYAFLCAIFVTLAQGVFPVPWRLFVGPIPVRAESPRVIFLTDGTVPIGVESVILTLPRLAPLNS